MASCVEPQSVGALALAVARQEIGVRSGQPRVRGYFSGATRPVRGVERATGFDAGWNWCAAFASWCAFQVTTKPPHGWRIAVWELVRDARQVNAFENWSPSIAEGPQAGDLIIYKRQGGDPRRLGQLGHVARCASWDGSRLLTIGGNEDGRVREQDNGHRSNLIVGFIRYEGTA